MYDNTISRCIDCEKELVNYPFSVKKYVCQHCCSKYCEQCATYREFICECTPKNIAEE